MIKPSIGRVVWYYRYGKTQLDAGEQPEAALIARVWSDTMINIGGFKPNGEHFAATSVRLVQEGETLDQNPFCCWMPYQIGQAKKDAQNV